MKITPLTVGQMSTNCYLVSDEETNESLIIDPGDEGDFISTTILENQLHPIGIILTHGHFDHCLAVLDLKLNFNIPIYLHQKDLFLYQKAHQSASFWNSSLRGRQPACRSRDSREESRGLESEQAGLTPPVLPPIDKFLVGGDQIVFGNSSLKVLHTPGHTPGSICLLSPAGPGPAGTLFTGDTLFAHGVGSTDHRYSSKTDLQFSLAKLNSLFLTHNSSLLIYPGHENTPVFLSDLS